LQLTNSAPSMLEVIVAHPSERRVVLELGLQQLNMLVLIFQLRLERQQVLRELSELVVFRLAIERQPISLVFHSRQLNFKI
jgi:hypothetical protein